MNLMLSASFKENQVTSGSWNGHGYHQLTQYGPTTLANLQWSINPAPFDFCNVFDKVFHGVLVDRTVVGILSNIAVK